MDGKKAVHDFDFIGRTVTILKILQEMTDEKHTISQTKILEEMKKRGCSCSARTLQDYLKVLMKELNEDKEDDFAGGPFSTENYRIIPKGLEKKLEACKNGLEKEENRKFQIRSLRYNHIFSFEELNQVIEAVLFLKSADTQTKERLISKLRTLSSTNYPKYSPFISETTGAVSTRISGVFEKSSADEKVVMNNLDKIRKAIEANERAGCKISFHFNGYNEKKELVPRKDKNGNPVTYIANPYYVILYNGKYYLICSVEPYENVAFYRIDLMSDISDKTKVSLLDRKTVISEKRKPKRDLEEAGLPLDWNDRTAFEFQTQHMYMFYGEPVRITLKIDRDRYTLLHDFFGDLYTFKRHIDDKWDEVWVECVPQAMEAWAMQCSDYVEVLRPAKLRKSICERCRKLAERYEED